MVSFPTWPTNQSLDEEIQLKQSFTSPWTTVPVQSTAPCYAENNEDPVRLPACLFAAAAGCCLQIQEERGQFNTKRKTG
ncbi:hypothetical protein CHARACLAT_027814 [Characodon lateralis]|uniref:Uncharacterized protein n=1 Tax=Characodon lateralis TaxID=208331 RepID=A0ABU7EDE4_9TELE|nr:hypothetical protein [Characodon lateralis]